MTDKGLDFFVSVFVGLGDVVDGDDGDSVGVAVGVGVAVAVGVDVGVSVVPGLGDDVEVVVTNMGSVVSVLLPEALLLVGSV